MSEDPRKIPDSTRLPEITVKALILGAALSILLAAANAYLGLFAGMTVSASIPAAVISMGILRFFRNSNVLENNIVQTAASAGESLAAGVIFTLPALIVMGYWGSFDYVQTTIIAALGGVIGVLFTIPLRRALIVEENLKFPEGVATAEVLHAGDKGEGIAYITKAALTGAMFKLCEVGLHIWKPVVEFAWKITLGAKQKAASVLYFGSNVSPALVSVGYIVGINIAVLVFLGGALNWFIAIPIYAFQNPGSQGDLTALDWAWTIWSTKTRYIGVGAMVVGGLWALIHLRSSIVSSVKLSLTTYKKGSTKEILRTEHDTPMNWVGIALIISLLPICGVYYFITGQIIPAVVMALVMLVAGFLFSAVASYMAGLVGSSNNPISGVTIATILFSSLLLLGLFKMGQFEMSSAVQGAAAAIFIGGVVACAAAIGGDNLQDLKAGHVLGATPWKQQVMQVVGVLSAALFIAPVLTLIHGAYGIGEPTKSLFEMDAKYREVLSTKTISQELRGSFADNKVELSQNLSVDAVAVRQGEPKVWQVKDSESGTIYNIEDGKEKLTVYPHPYHKKPLKAPQATLMMSVANGVFEWNLPWLFIGIGAVIAVLIIILDKVQEVRGSSFRLPVLAVAVGIYLPFELSVPILLGGVITWLIQRRWNAKKLAATSEEEKKEIETLEQKGATQGLLFASGLIAGEALVGILVAIPIVISGDKNVLVAYKPALGVILLLGVMAWMYGVGFPQKKENS